MGVWTGVFWMEFMAHMNLGPVSFFPISNDLVHSLMYRVHGMP